MNSTRLHIYKSFQKPDVLMPDDYPLHSTILDEMYAQADRDMTN